MGPAFHLRGQQPLTPPRNCYTRASAGPWLVEVARLDVPTLTQQTRAGHSAVLCGQTTQPGNGRPRSPVLVIGVTEG